MKNIALILFSLCLIKNATAQDLHEDALTAASYAYSHSKKAHGANNVFHTQEYADKAVEAFLKVEDLADQCGCEEANETAYLARVDMESSLNEDTYERSRFFAKRAKDMGPKLLDQLTNCQMNKAGYVANDGTDEVQEQLAYSAEVVSEKQMELEKKRLLLEEEQKKLELQIAEQNKRQAEYEAMRAAELKQQSLVKSKAELALQKLETALQELSVVLNNEAKFEAQSDYTRSENELINESLIDTKSFYVDRVKELTKTAMQQFASYNAQ